MSDFDIQKTYLYKLHLATAELDSFFEHILRHHANMSLSQFLLLQAVKQKQPVKQGQIAKFLMLNPPTLSRQVEAVRRKGWLTVNRYHEDNVDRRVQVLGLTPDGEQKRQVAMNSLKKQGFHIFKDQDTPGSLMKHIDQLLNNMKGEKQ